MFRYAAKSCRRLSMSAVTIILFTLCLGQGKVYSVDKLVPAYPDTAEGVVKAFCKSDYKGAGLGSSTLEDLQQYTTGEDGPGWDQAVVISKFKVTNTKGDEQTADLAVEYDVVATLTAGERLSVVNFGAAKEIVNFRLIRRDNVWKIFEPQLPPHISAEKAIDLLQQEITTGKDPGLIAKHVMSIKRLKTYTVSKGGSYR